jgi:hypothetical protein
MSNKGHRKCAVCRNMWALVDGHFREHRRSRTIRGHDQRKCPGSGRTPDGATALAASLANGRATPPTPDATTPGPAPE